MLRSTSVTEAMSLNRFSDARVPYERLKLNPRFSLCTEQSNFSEADSSGAILKLPSRWISRNVCCVAIAPNSG